jgi:hypothetical protein
MLFDDGSYIPYPKVSSVLSLKNPQNCEMKFCENMKLT